MLKKLIVFFSVAITLVVPFAIYFGIKYQLLTYVLALLIVVNLLRLTTFNFKNSKVKVLSKVSFFTVIILIVLAITQLVIKDLKLIYYYPVAVNFVFLSAFLISLFSKEAIITKFAKLIHPNLEQFEIDYTRNVTKAWCLFFVVNGLIALYTVLSHSIELWTLYNGLISYLAIGVFALIELLIRKIVKAKHGK